MIRNLERKEPSELHRAIVVRSSFARGASLRVGDSSGAIKSVARNAFAEVALMDEKTCRLDDVVPAVSRLSQSVEGLRALIGECIREGHALAREHTYAAFSAARSGHEDAKHKADLALDAAVERMRDRLLARADELLPMFSTKGAPSRQNVHQTLCDALLVGFNSFNDLVAAAVMGCPEKSSCPGVFLDPSWLAETSDDLLHALLDQLRIRRIPVPGATAFHDRRRGSR